jgi:flagellar biosynthesis/type III secretory pathway protein FliH
MQKKEKEMPEEVTYFSESKQKPIAVSTMCDQHVRYAFIKHLRNGNGNYKKAYNKGYEDGLNKASELLDNIGKENKNVTTSDS